MLNVSSRRLSNMGAVKLMRWTEEDVRYLINIIKKAAKGCFQKWGMYQVCFSEYLRYLYLKWCLNILQLVGQHPESHNLWWN